MTWRGDADQLVERVQRWRNAGASHVAINTMRAGLGTVDDHLGRAGGRRRGARAELTTAGA